MSEYFSKYTRLSKDEKKLFFKAVRHLIGAYFTTKLFPIRKYHKKLGKKNTESSYEDDKNKELVLKIKDSLRRGKKVIPLNIKCLQEAFAGKIILNKENISSTIYFGLAKDENKKLIAHAWLRSGNIIITGKSTMNKFTVVEKIT